MFTYKKVLAPVDFAEISNSVLQQAASHSEQNQSKLVITHVVDLSFPEYDSTEAMNMVSVEEALVRNAEQHLDQLLDELEIGYCDKIVRTGKIVPTLLDIIVELGVDLVVMGTHIRSPASERYKSVTMAMAERAGCDVLVLHK